MVIDLDDHFLACLNKNPSMKSIYTDREGEYIIRVVFRPVQYQTEQD